MISLILAIQLLTSSLHVCFSNPGDVNASEVMSEQTESNKNGCCKSIGSDDSSQEEKSTCNDGCACCFFTTVVFIDQDKPSNFNPEVNPQLKDRVTNNYTHDFTHLIWHPPQIV